MIHRLHIYTVHTRPGALPESEPPVFVREGFSIPAFIFTFLWALYHRLWAAALGIFCFNGLVMLLQEHGFISEGQSLALLLGLQLVAGFHANDWWRAKLKMRGYITAGIVTGDSALRAQMRFFEQRTA